MILILPSPNPHHLAKHSEHPDQVMALLRWLDEANKQIFKMLDLLEQRGSVSSTPLPSLHMAAVDTDFMLPPIPAQPLQRIHQKVTFQIGSDVLPEEEQADADRTQCH